MAIRFPDASIHKFCMRCHRWFEPEEGCMILPEATGPISGLRRAAASIAGDDSAYRFICRRCLRRRWQFKIILWFASAVVIGLALLSAWIRGQL